MQFAERFLSDHKADERHWKGVSFKNCMLRIPGSTNSKNNTQVQIIQRWNGTRPAINWLLRDYRRYLIQETYVKPRLPKQRSTMMVTGLVIGGIQNNKLLDQKNSRFERKKNEGMLPPLNLNPPLNLRAKK